MTATFNRGLWAPWRMACALAMTLPGVLVAQDPAKTAEGNKAATRPSSPQVTVPVDALKFGAELKKNAPDALLKWVHKQAAGEARNDDEPIKRLMRTVEEGFPTAPPALHDAIIFMVFYSQYESDSAMQEGHTNDLRIIDRDIAKLKDELRIWEEAFSHPEPGSTASAQREVRLRQITEDLAQLVNKRRPAAMAQALYRQRVNFSLILLGHGYKALAKLPPAMIARVPAPAN